MANLGDTGETAEQTTIQPPRGSEMPPVGMKGDVVLQRMRTACMYPGVLAFEQIQRRAISTTPLTHWLVAENRA